MVRRRRGRRVLDWGEGDGLVVSHVATRGGRCVVRHLLAHLQWERQGLFHWVRDVADHWLSEELFPRRRLVQVLPGGGGEHLVWLWGSRARRVMHRGG